MHWRRKMELLQLKYFCDAAQTENFSKTAKKYLVPTSNISRAIRCLEKELGCELFEHKVNKVSLNYDGKQFYANASQALALLETAKSRLSDKSETVSGDISLVCMNNRRTVTSAIEKFIQRYPAVKFVIHHNLDAQENFDVLISDVCPYDYGKKILLVDEEICLAVNREHLLANCETVSVSALENERFITMTAGNSMQKITVNLCADAGFTPNIAIQTDDPFYLRKYIEMGLGIAFVPSNSWSGLFPESVVLKRLERIRRKTYAFLPKGVYTKRSVELFLEALISEVTREKEQTSQRA